MSKIKKTIEKGIEKFYEEDEFWNRCIGVSCDEVNKKLKLYTISILEAQVSEWEGKHKRLFNKLSATSFHLAEQEEDRILTERRFLEKLINQNKSIIKSLK